MIALVLKVTVLLAIASLACFALRRRPAALRHGVWTAAMAVLLSLPVAPQPGPMTVAAPAGVRAAAETIAVEVVPEATRAHPVPWFAVVWLLGTTAVALWYAAGIAALWRLSRRAAPLGEFEGIRVGTSTRVTIPFTWGVVRPAILLPETARDWDGERLRLVLLHEAIHVRRWDWPAQCLARAACALYWFHPLVWYAERRMRQECERACDDAVLRAGVPAVRYAEHLLALTEWAAGSERFPAAGVGMWDFRQLEARMRTLLDGTVNRRRPGRMAWGLLAAAAMLTAVPLALLSLRAQGTATLRGVVQDASGGRVPEAHVLLENSGRREITYSGADGAFGFAALMPGAYTLTVMQRGFARWDKKVEVTGEGSNADVTLQVGKIQETMEITGSRPKRPVATGAAGPPPQRIRVGGNVQPTRLLVHVKPTYPEELQELGVEGTVLLDAVIGTGGQLLSLRPANTQVHPGLVKAAMDAVNQWRYQPTLLNGQPVEVVTTITVRYRLPSN